MVMIVVLLAAGIVHFKIAPILNMKTGFVWVFAFLAYISAPVLLKLLFSLTFLALTGKSRKQL